jgi:hypothetical protein
VVLQRVIYELFGSDAHRLDAFPDRDYHEIDREVHLITADGKHLFISVHFGAGGGTVRCHDRSQFQGEPDEPRDMSDAPWWRSLVGHPIALRYLDDSHLILEVSSEMEAVYCCAREGKHWGHDAMQITNKRPVLPD